jgi:hypothetical protein
MLSAAQEDISAHLVEGAGVAARDGVSVHGPMPTITTAVQQ